MHQISAIVCFGIAEPQVDDLIEATRDTIFESARWFVFGSDICRLGGLAAYWQGRVEVVIVHLPRADASMQDAALLILENEGVPVPGCIWLQHEDPQCPLPAGTRAARLGPCAPHDCLDQLYRLATTGVSGFN
jgi:hypothetical protein